ncbi:DUF2312 domain-containing protein [Rhodobacteraceae bacterium]|nr:DUF2312 domain-containing protein [Paracoccaceae bacterium]
MTDIAPDEAAPSFLDKAAASADRADKKHRFKEDPEFKAAAQKAYDVTADELRQFVEQFESLAAEKSDIAAQQKDVIAEAKARGYDTKVLKLLIALRKRDKDDVAEEQAILDIYKEALGMS